VPLSPGIRLTTFRGSQAWDLTEYAEGLSWSSVDPGGDERASWQLKRSWFAGAPEVAQGNVVWVTDGLDVLWAGRIEENNRRGDSTEMIGIEAFGLGVRLKDETEPMIFVDRDLSRWQGPSVQRQINLVTGAIDVEGPSVEADSSTGQPSLKTGFQGAWSRVHVSEGWYDAQGIPIGSVYYAWKRGPAVDNGDTNWNWVAHLSDDDVASDFNSTSSLRAAGPDTGTLAATESTREFALVQLVFGTGAGSDGVDYALYWTCLAVFGNHGLTVRGTQDATHAGGFYAADIVRYVLDQVQDIEARDVQDTNFLIEQLAYFQPTVREQMISDVAKFENVNWGTWGPRSALDNSRNGYFDFKPKDAATVHWLAHRRECDSVELNSELANLYNKVSVRYRDVTGRERVIVRTATVPVLDELGLTKEPPEGIDAGVSTEDMAAQRGDIFLALSGNRPPARGSVSISQPITHYRRGRLAPHHMRADGSNIRVPDVLPARDLFSLSLQPDRLTTFPIKRVSVDASGPVPKVTAEVDQVNDLMSQLTARLQLKTDLIV